MTQWEYSRIEIPHAELDNALVQGGQQGWELVALLPGAIQPKIALVGGRGPVPGFMLLFKRPLPALNGHNFTDQDGARDALFSRI